MTIRDLLVAADTTTFLPPHHPRLLPEARGGQTWEGEQGLLNWADKLADEPDQALSFTSFLRFFRDGDRQEYEEQYFQRRRRLEVFALAVLSGHGDRFVGPLENVLAAVCEEATWALPAHVDPVTLDALDLFAAETGSALAEIRGLVGERLSPELVKRLDKVVRRRIVEPFLDPSRRWSWETATHNWAAVCAGGVGLAALWSLEAPELGRVLVRIGPVLDAYLSGFPEDGICLEGMGYWTYGFGFFVAFAELLRDRSRGAVDILRHPDFRERFEALAAFPEAARIGNRDFARFSDALAEYRYPPGLVHRLTEIYGVPGPLPPKQVEDLAFDPCCRWARHVRDFVWLSPEHRGHRKKASPAGDRWYPDSQWLILRGKLGGAEIGMAAKGGNNAEPHNHNDVGSFHIVAGDDALIDDLGAGRYDRDYFGPGRYGSFVTSSASHSVPLVDGQGQREGAGHRADSVSFQKGKAGCRLDLELAAAYDRPALASLHRTIEGSSNGPEKVVMTDSFRFVDDARHEVIERLVTRLAARRTNAGFVIMGRVFSLEIQADPAPTETRMTPVVFSPHHGADQTAFCLDFVFVTGEAAPGFRLVLQVRQEDSGFHRPRK